MPGIGFTVRFIDKNRYIEQMFKRSNDASRLAMRVGQMLVQQSRRAFDEQAFDGKPWSARSVPNILGVVKDLESGPAVKSQRFQSRPALVETGALKSSIGWELLGHDSLRVTSNLPYSKLMNEGGASTKQVTASVKSNLSIYLKSRPDERPYLGFLFRRGSVSCNVPGRPFLSLTQEGMESVKDLSSDFLLQRGEFKL